MSLQEALTTAAKNPRNVAAQPKRNTVPSAQKKTPPVSKSASAQPTQASKLPSVGTGSQVPGVSAPKAPKKKRKFAGRITTKKRKRIESAFAKKREKMKELFRDVDGWNFPPGARLTLNSSGRIDRGGGFLSNRRKF